jgi:hypothetical protein
MEEYLGAPDCHNKDRRSAAWKIDSLRTTLQSTESLHPQLRYDDNLLGDALFDRLGKCQKELHTLESLVVDFKTPIKLMLVEARSCQVKPRISYPFDHQKIETVEVKI